MDSDSDVSRLTFSLTSCFPKLCGLSLIISCHIIFLLTIFTPLIYFLDFISSRPLLLNLPPFFVPPFVRKTFFSLTSSLFWRCHLCSHCVGLPLFGPGSCFSKSALGGEVRTSTQNQNNVVSEVLNEEKVQ